VEVEYSWSGVLGNPLHRMPQIGELSPGLWLASGFGGHGLNTTAMAGNIVAQGIAEGDDSWRLFAPFELVWAGGTLGRAAIQVYYWWFGARERWAARQARQREDEFRRAEELAVLHAGDDQPESEAKLGAVVPPQQLPKEPPPGDLPGDPVLGAGATIRPMQEGEAPQRGGRKRPDAAGVERYGQEATVGSARIPEASLTQNERRNRRN
jgi:hypothetical protein